MSNADIFIEMIRMAEQIGEVETAMMYPSDYITVEGTTKGGKKFGMNLTMREAEKDGN